MSNPRKAVKVPFIPRNPMNNDTPSMKKTSQMKQTSQMKLEKYRMIAVITFGVYMPILRIPMDLMDIVNFSHSDF